MVAKVDLSTDLGIEIESFVVSKDARGLSPRTLEMYRFELGRLQKWLAGQDITETQQIARLHLDKYLLYLRDKNLKPNSRHAAFRAFRVFLNWYADVDAPKDWRNPVLRMQGPQVPKNRVPAPPFENLVAIINTCTTHSFMDDRDRALMMLMFDTGLRAQECASLDYGDLDLPHQKVFVKHPKGGKTRYAYPSAPVVKAIRHYLKHRGADLAADAPVWTSSDGKRLTYWGLRQIVERRAEKIGVPMPQLHGFRRAFATAQNEQGVPTITIQHMLGHADGGTIWRYVDINETHLEAVQRKTSPVAKYLS